MEKRLIYYVSDSTAITAKAMGRSLLAQYSSLSFKEVLEPFIDSEQKMKNLLAKILKNKDNLSPIIFATIIDENLANILTSSDLNVVDLIRPFLSSLNDWLGIKHTRAVGHTRGVKKQEFYQSRLKAMDYALMTDDGVNIQKYDEADIILLGVSRTGKTPSAIYLAMEFGIKAANYPFIADDLPTFSLNEQLKTNKNKLFGITINAQRLAQIRTARAPNKKYSNKKNIEKELLAIETLFNKENIPFLDATFYSIEEISSNIISWLQNK